MATPVKEMAPACGQPASTGAHACRCAAVSSGESRAKVNSRSALTMSVSSVVNWRMRKLSWSVRPGAYASARPAMPAARPLPEAEETSAETTAESAVNVSRMLEMNSRRTDSQRLATAEMKPARRLRSKRAMFSDSNLAARP